MLKCMIAAALWLLASSLTLAQTNASKAADQAQKSKEAVEAIQKECDKGDKADLSKIKQKLEEARQAAQNAKEFADAAKAEGKDADKAAKSAEAAAKSAGEAGAAAGGLTEAEQAAQRIDKKKEALKELADEDKTLCEGELGTAESLLDAVKKKVMELGDKYPCKPEKVRQELNNYLEGLRNNRKCDKLREWIDKLFTFNVEQNRFLVSVYPSIPADIVATATGTGRTNGHIADLSLFNPTDQVVSMTIGPSLIPSNKNRQPYLVSNSTIITVGPGATVTVPLQGNCADIHLPPVPAGHAMPPVKDWITAGPLPAGWAPSVANGWIPAPNSPALIPGTNQPLGHTIDLQKHPREAAPVLFEAFTRIAAAYDDLKTQGLVSTPFSAHPEKEKEAVTQQTFWLYAAELTGQPYEREDFAANTIKQYESNSGQKFQTAPPAARDNVEQGITQFWDTFEAVGAEAKVIKP